MSIHLSALYLHPVKSCASLAVDSAAVEPRGLAGDRRWMIVDAAGEFVTGRSEPRLVLVRTRETPQGLHLQAPSLPDLVVPVPPLSNPRPRVTVWNSQVDALDAGDEAAAWISAFNGRPCRLVYMDAAAHRPVSPTHARPGDEVSFADAYPLLIISEASLAGLNAQLDAPVPMLRFRPNLVVRGAQAHEEDRWQRIRIAGIEFEMIKPCVRCGFTTVMPETGTLDPRGEPLRTLAKYRRADKGVIFGQNVIARGSGRLRVGDAVEITR